MRSKPMALNPSLGGPGRFLWRPSTHSRKIELRGTGNSPSPFSFLELDLLAGLIYGLSVGSDFIFLDCLSAAIHSLRTYLSSPPIFPTELVRGYDGVRLQNSNRNQNGLNVRLVRNFSKIRKRKESVNLENKSWLGIGMIKEQESFCLIDDKILVKEKESKFLILTLVKKNLKL